MDKVFTFFGHAELRHPCTLGLQQLQASDKDLQQVFSPPSRPHGAQSQSHDPRY